MTPHVPYQVPPQVPPNADLLRIAQGTQGPPAPTSDSSTETAASKRQQSSPTSTRGHALAKMASSMEKLAEAVTSSLSADAVPNELDGVRSEISVVKRDVLELKKTMGKVITLLETLCANHTADVEK